jgi:hypothetical protein
MPDPTMMPGSAEYAEFMSRPFNSAVLAEPLEPPPAAPIAYVIDPITGALLYSTPFPGEDLEPLCAMGQVATRLAPPPFSGGFVPKFKAGEWLLEQDHAGEVWFTPDGSPIVLEAGVDPVARGLTRDPPPPTPAALTAYRADRRRRAVDAGVMVGGVPFRTDRDSRSDLVGAIVWAGLYPDGVRQWLTPTGWVDLTSQQLVAAGVAVATHVQDCFDLQAVLEASIDDGTITTPAEIDATTWPPGA